MAQTPRFGDTLRPELGATDYSPFLKGSMAGSAAIGQGIAGLGKGAAQFMQDNKDKKNTIAKNTKMAEAFLTINPDMEDQVRPMLNELSLMDSTKEQFVAASIIPSMIQMATTKKAQVAAAAQQKFENTLATNTDVRNDGDRRDRSTAASDDHSAHFAEEEGLRLANAGATQAQSRTAGGDVGTVVAGLANFSPNTPQEAIEAALAAQPGWQDMTPAAKSAARATVAASQQALRAAQAKKPNIALEAMAKVVGEENAAWVTQGRIASNQAFEALAELVKVDPDTGKTEVDRVGTGPIAGAVNWVPGVKNVFTSKLVHLKETIETVALKGLKATFPGAISNAEREALVKTFFNPSLSEDKNVEKLNAFLRSLKTAADIKDKIADDLNTYGAIRPETQTAWSSASRDMMSMVGKSQDETKGPTKAERAKRALDAAAKARRGQSSTFGGGVGAPSPMGGARRSAPSRPSPLKDEYEATPSEAPAPAPAPAPAQAPAPDPHPGDAAHGAALEAAKANAFSADGQAFKRADKARAARIARTIKTDSNGKAEPTSRVKYSNSGAKRNQRIAPKLMGQIDASVAKSGLTAEIFSGGQTDRKSGTGSHRHNHGNAADITLSFRGKELSPTDPAHQKHFESFIIDAVANGATGIGLGKGYMTSTKGVHVGYNPKDFKGVWGKNGDSAEAPKWAKLAYKKGAALAAKRKTHKK